MKKILNLLVNTWDSMTPEQKSKIIDELSPNKVVKEVVESISNMREDYYEDEVEVEDKDDDVIDVEFVDDLNDTFGQ